MNLGKKLEQRKQKTLANPPTSVQLPGGVTLKAMNFRITAVDSGGRPTAFELVRGNEDSDCIFWGYPPFVDDKLPAHLDERYRARIEASIEGPDLVTEEREYKGRSVGISTTGRQLGKTEASTQALKDAMPGPQCKVCGAVPNLEGERKHGKGCFEVDEEGGGSDWPDPDGCCSRFMDGDGTHDIGCSVIKGFCPLSEPFGHGTRKCACHGVGTRAR